ncbi:UDP-N-acetylmuramoyl-L-alanyl-D-glutamate--2,6-diaminopimelate ligase [Candidatus Berkelbacteria bacterium]|nr:UDP-N-acetylmuramoyl-L-alanyl-D-glutamate--2,6-diaminopimelate ligase [Candidatus Berkelbacteria bacterium]
MHGLWSALKRRIKPLLPDWAIDASHGLRAVVASMSYRFPARGMTVIAVTGTNGKTTTANMIAQILEAANEKVAMLTTVNFRVSGRSIPNETKMTTISPFALEQFIAKARDAGAKFLVLETTSHAIKQRRIWGIPIDMAVLTNVTHDHLDYHATFKEYRATKARIFRSARFAIVNRDDPSASVFEKAARGTKLSYGIATRADVMARKLFRQTGSTMFSLIAPTGQVVVDLPLPGLFNVANALAAAAAVIPYGVSLTLIKKTLEHFEAVSGRMEVLSLGQPFTVLVDYAHTPDAFEKIYAALKGGYKGRLIHVFGATGDRDKTKRPILGALAGRNADIVIVTNEDPYTEDPQEIIDQVAQGVARGAKKYDPKRLGENFFVVANRREAVRRALSLAKRNDLVLLTGKGHERVMVVGTEKVAYSEQEVVRAELKTLGYGR